MFCHMQSVSTHADMCSILINNMACGLVFCSSVFWYCLHAEANDQDPGGQHQATPGCLGAWFVSEVRSTMSADICHHLLSAELGAHCPWSIFAIDAGRRGLTASHSCMDLTERPSRHGHAMSCHLTPSHIMIQGLPGQSLAHHLMQRAMAMRLMSQHEPCVLIAACLPGGVALAPGSPLIRAAGAVMMGLGGTRTRIGTVTNEDIGETRPRTVAAWHGLLLNGMLWSFRAVPLTLKDA